jgi:hypothetical protein
MNGSGGPARQCRHCEHARPHKGVASLFGLLPSKWELAECGRAMRAEMPGPGVMVGTAVLYRHPPCVVERAIDFSSCGPSARFFSERA